MDCQKANPNCEGDLRSTPNGMLCGWHDAVSRKQYQEVQCDHCLGPAVVQRIEIDGLRDDTVKIKLCRSCYNKLLEKMKDGS